MIQYFIVVVNKNALDIDKLKSKTIKDLNLPSNNNNIILHVSWNIQNNDIAMDSSSNPNENDQNSNQNSNNNSQNNASNPKDTKMTDSTDNNANTGNNNDDGADDMSLDSTHNPNMEQKYETNENDATAANDNTSNNTGDANKQITPQPDENGTNTNNNSNNTTNNSSNNNNNNSNAMETDETMDAATRALIDQIMAQDSHEVDNEAAIRAAMGISGGANDSKMDEDDVDSEMPTFPDFEFDESKLEASVTALARNDVTELFDLLWGKFANIQDMKRWFSQGIDFVDMYEDRLKFGLLQIHGGPCGILAPVQVLFCVLYCFSVVLSHTFLIILAQQSLRRNPCATCNNVFFLVI